MYHSLCANRITSLFFLPLFRKKMIDTYHFIQTFQGWISQETITGHSSPWLMQWIITNHGLTGFIFVQTQLCIRYWLHAEPSTLTATARQWHLSWDLWCKCVIKRFLCAPCIDSSEIDHSRKFVEILYWLSTNDNFTLGIGFFSSFGVLLTYSHQEESLTFLRSI